MSSDNLLSIIRTDIVFTRYLYVKDEVCIALLLAILNKNDSAIYWAYELYYSGFRNELFALLWQIYYDFFATLNPEFAIYFSKKHKEWLKNADDTIVSSIVQCLLYRPFNTDVFFLRKLTSSFQIDVEYIENATVTSLLEHWLDANDFRSLGQWILYENTGIPLMEIYLHCLNWFTKKGLNVVNKLTKDVSYMMDSKPLCEKVILLASIMTLVSKLAQLKKGRAVYITALEDDIAAFQQPSDITHYRVLSEAAIYSIDESRCLSLFKLKRNKYNLTELYRYSWEYYASFSPLWFQRIREHRGYVDYVNKKVMFIDDDDLQQFYGLYGLEPDEQPKAVQERSIMAIEKVSNWLQFYNTFKKNGLLEVYDEELEEWDTDGLGL
jgi:hypothetical protein